MANEMEEILRQLQGDFQASEYCQIVETTLGTQPIVQKNAGRNGVVISANLTNTGIVFLGFTRNVSSRSFFMTLLAGDWISLDDFRGEIFAVADTASQSLGIGEW